MIGGDLWFKAFPFILLMALDYQRLSDADFGFLIRCQCYIALHGWLPSDPVELGKAFGIRPSSAQKKLEVIREFFVEIEDLSPSLRELICGIHGDFQKSPASLTMPSFLRENAEFLATCKQVRSSRKPTRKAKPNRNPDGLDWDAIEEEGDTDRDGEQTNTSPSGGGEGGTCGVKDVDFVRPASPASPAKPTKSTPASEFDLDAVLGTHKPTWQRLIDVFGSANVKPATDAPRIVALLDSGKVTAENLLKSARALRSQRSGPRYMGKLSAWLDSGGHLVCSDPDSHTPSMAPAHRQKAEEAASDQWSKYLEPTGTQPTLATHQEPPHGTEP